MSNIREFKREATEAELRMADKLEALAKRVRNGELTSVAYIALDPKESDDHYVLGQDAIGFLGAVHLMMADITDEIRSWTR